MVVRKLLEPRLLGVEIGQRSCRQGAAEHRGLGIPLRGDMGKNLPERARPLHRTPGELVGGHRLGERPELLPQAINVFLLDLTPGGEFGRVTYGCLCPERSAWETRQT